MLQAFSMKPWFTSAQVVVVVYSFYHCPPHLSYFLLTSNLTLKLFNAVEACDKLLLVLVLQFS